MKNLISSTQKQKRVNFPNIVSEFRHLTPFGHISILKNGVFLKKCRKIVILTNNFYGYHYQIWLKSGSELQINTLYLVYKFQVDMFRSCHFLFRGTHQKQAKKRKNSNFWHKMSKLDRKLTEFQFFAYIPYKRIKFFNFCTKPQVHSTKSETGVKLLRSGPKQRFSRFSYFA